MDAFDTVRPDADGLLRRSALRAAGYGDAEIDRMRRRGLLLGVRRGVYRWADGGVPPPTETHALRARAATPELSGEAVYSHSTAAVLLGLPLWRTPLDRLHVLRDRSGGGRLRTGVHVHVAPVPDGDVIDIDGIRLTSAARTVVDLARTLAAEQALVAADGALHKAVVSARTGEYDPGATTASEVAACLGRFTGRRGVPSAARLLAFADAASESPGETRSRFRMHVAGLPPPITQWPVPGTRYRSDFGWPEIGVVGEFDGRIKYARGRMTPDEDMADVVWREKQREDRIRETGLIVVRWTWSEIDGDAMVARLRKRLG
ncbi:MAG: type IV toxin-antitoxin system AbiEi family antitoxin domain-containing protein [Actinomycetota bacterium]|nr:type IV toxin-antitoxin system AbiEi family antitoxin domain-containing protein [Actinomycetota bacterium]